MSLFSTSKRFFQQSGLSVALSMAVCVFSTGCGSGISSGGTATASFSMGQTTSTSFSALASMNLVESMLKDPGQMVGILTDPTYYTFTGSDHFKVKLIAAYLTEDVDPTTQNNIGSTQMIYLNPECNEDISSCDASSLTTFFEFNQTESALNAALNSQSRTIEAGDYKYVRLELCKYTPAAANLKFTVNSLAELGVISGRCTMNSGNDGSSSTLVPMSPVATVGSGDTVQVRLEYNINRFISVETGTTDTANCKSDGTTNRYCNHGYFFKPSVTID